ncbi:hypothetical protein TRFO_34781 [Tritrichomonas foetus]|uniref:Uncharacterized protein n=1 Tax=Tritrichomonas foetus TaxID=1144522 RepID=A0A1J4JIB5_9EUKA|nr:hypothetical protein TRFO_34781 [Tritrichomonas foetus]|eukprot:OHS98878.1 hypothetical protein TRFO_34781 [Tritrichomonas foetus]
MDPFVTSLHMTRDDANEVTPKLSQNFMIEDVDLGSDFMHIPSSMFAALPLIRQDPSRLRFSDGRPATEDILHKMVLLANFLPDARITFKFPNGKIIESVFPAGTSTYTILTKLLPEISTAHSILFFVRTQKRDGTRLLIRPSSYPIGIYDMPNCIWHVEFAYIPDYLKFNETYKLMLSQWFNARKEVYVGRKPANETMLDTYSQEILEVENQNDLNTFIEKIGFKQNCSKVRKYVTSEFSIKVDWCNSQKEVTVKKGSKKYAGLNLSTARINRVEKDKLIFSMKGMDDIEMNDSDAKLLNEFFNLAVIEKKAEEHPEKSLLVLFPEPFQTETSIPQVTVTSKINKLRIENAKTVIDQQHSELKNRPLFGWTEPELEE